MPTDHRPTDLAARTPGSVHGFLPSGRDASLSLRTSRILSDLRRCPVPVAAAPSSSTYKHTHRRRRRDAGADDHHALSPPAAPAGPDARYDRPEARARERFEYLCVSFPFRIYVPSRLDHEPSSHDTWQNGPGRVRWTVAGRAARDDLSPFVRGESHNPTPPVRPPISWMPPPEFEARTICVSFF